jgi:hypothetical protein
MVITWRLFYPARMHLEKSRVTADQLCNMFGQSATTLSNCQVRIKHCTTKKTKGLLVVDSF